MAASIAKLAIVVTTDTKQMSAGLQRAQGELKGFKSTGVSAGNEIAAGFNKAALALFSAAKIAQFGKQAFRFMADAALDMQDAINEMTGGNKLDTLRGQLERLRGVVGLELLGGAEVATVQLKTLIKFIDEIDRKLGRPITSDVLADLNRETERAKELEKQRLESLKKIEEQRRREEQALERLKDRAADLTKELRNPGEVLLDAQKELRELLNKGLLDAETFNRGLSRSTDEFRAAARAALEFKFQSTPAAEQGSQAALSTINRARVEQQVDREVSAQLNQLLKVNRQQLQAAQKPPLPQFFAAVGAIN